MAAIKTIKGAKKGQEKARKPSIAKDSASSVSTTKILYGLSEGEIVGLANGAASIRLESTPLVDENGQPNFEGVTWDFREGTNEQEYIKGFPDVSNETPIGVELKSSTPWVRAINDTQLSAIRVRFRWDRLLQTNDENGDITGYKIEYAIDLKTDSSAYREVLNTKIEDKTSAGYERTHRIDLPRATSGWQIRIRRITPNSTSEYIQDKMYIDAIAEVIDVKLRYPNTALLGLQYNAETFSRIAKLEVDTIGKIIRVPVNYNAINKTYSGIWDGTFKDAYSNNPAWIYYDLVTQWRYGIGEKLDDSMIDKWSIYRLGQYCDEKVSDGQGGLEPRFECNVYLQSQEDAYMVLSHLGGIFTAMSYWNGEKIVLDADVPQDPVYTFSAANVVEGNFEYTGTRQRDRHALAKVAWDNPNNSYQTEYEYIRDEEAMAKYGVKPLDLSAFGCTSQAQAQRLGLRALKAEQLETRQVAFSVGLDGFIPQVGNIINISDELFAGRALSGRLSSVSAGQYVVTLDRDIAISSGDTLAINGSNGKTEKRTVKSVVGRKVTLNTPFEFAASESIWALETPSLKLMRFRVMQINQNDDATFNIVALQHDPSKYAGIDNGTDVKDTHNNAGNQALQPTDKIDAPTNVVISPRYRVEQGLSITTLVVQWNQVSNAVGYIVELKKDNEAWRPLPRTNTNYIELDNAYAGVYTARVRAISPFGVESAYAESVSTTIAKKEGVPTAPLSLSVYGILFGMQLNWQFGTGSADTAFTEIQQATDPLIEASISQQGIYAYPTDNVTIQGLGTDVYVSYRARLIDKFGIAGAWTNWVEGQTSSDAQAALDLLAGQISKTQLAQDMMTAIDKIEVNELSISTETQARIDQILALNTDFQEFGVAVEQSITTLQNATGAQAEKIDVIIADYRPEFFDKTKYLSSTAEQWTYAKSVARDNYALSQKTELVSAKVDVNDAKYMREITTLATDTEAITKDVQQISAKTDNNLALINSESTTRADQFSAVSTQVTQVSATAQSALDATVTNKALIQSETQARVTKDGVFAGQINTVQTQANGNLASIQQHTQSINGLYGQYTLKVDVNGRISGFGLASSNVASAFAINADRFYIVSPDDPNYGDLGFVYNSGVSTDPETGIVIPKGLYLKAAFIKNGSIDTLKIRGQAVTVMSSIYQQVTSGSTVPIQTYTTPNVYLNSGGAQVLVRINFFMFDTKGSITVTFLKNGGDPKHFNFSKNGWGMGSLTENVEFILNGGYANDAYTVRVTSGSNEGFLLAAYTFTVTALKR